MLLSPEESDRFLKLYKSLFLYANQRYKILPNVKTITDLEEKPLEDHLKLRNKLYQKPELFEGFIQDKLSEDDSDTITTVLSWKDKHIQDRFFLFRYLKNYAIFLTAKEPYKAYGVLGLTTPLPDMIDSSILPTVVETVLLPFEGRIVCDGFILGGNIIIGSGMSAGIKTSYEEAKARFGIITSLDTPIQEAESADVARLKAYLKTERSREEYAYEIEALREKSPELKLVYAQEMGKIYAKYHSKRYKEIGLKNIWFALFEEMPIASGKTKSDVEQAVNEILPKSQQKFVYIFQVKGK